MASDEPAASLFDPLRRKTARRLVVTTEIIVPISISPEKYAPTAVRMPPTAVIYVFFPVNITKLFAFIAPPVPFQLLLYL